MKTRNLGKDALQNGWSIHLLLKTYAELPSLKTQRIIVDNQKQLIGVRKDICLRVFRVVLYLYRSPSFPDIEIWFELLGPTTVSPVHRRK